MKIIAGFPPGGTTEVIGRLVVSSTHGTTAQIVRLLNADVNKLIVKPAYVQRFAGRPGRGAACLHA